MSNKRIDNKKKHQKYTLNSKGERYPIKSKMKKGYFVSFESLMDTAQIAYRFAKSVQESNPKLTIFFMRFPTYFELEDHVFKYLSELNNSIIECNIKYFDDKNVRKTIDSLNEYQVNNRLNIMSGINYIHMLPILARINKINHLTTHYNLVVVANYFNSIKALAINNQHIYRAMKFVYENYVPKSDKTYMIDISSTKIKPILEKMKYEYFSKEQVDRYRLALLNMLNTHQGKHKVDIIDYNEDNKVMLADILRTFNPLEKYITKSIFN